MTKTSSSSGQLQGQGLLLSNSSLATCSSDCRNFSEDEQRHRRDVRREREARSLALEKAYVHDVYEQISANFSDSRYRPWPRVKQFLMDLEPGSFVCDVGECNCITIRMERYQSGLFILCKNGQMFANKCNERS